MINIVYIYLSHLILTFPLLDIAFSGDSVSVSSSNVIVAANKKMQLLQIVSYSKKKCLRKLGRMFTYPSLMKNMFNLTISDMNIKQQT